MDVDDEFGDLYANIGPEIGKSMGTEPSGGEGDLDEEELLYGTSSTPLLAVSSKPPSLTLGSLPRSGIQAGLPAKDDDHDELLLYGQLYGVSTGMPVKADSPLPGAENKAGSVSKLAKRQDSRENARSMGIPDESNFDLLEADSTNSPEHVLGLSADIPLGVAGLATASGERTVEKDSAGLHGRTLEGFGNRSLPPNNDSLIVRIALPVSDATGQRNSPPGLSTNARAQQEFVAADGVEGRELQEVWDGGLDDREEEQNEGDVEDWDSDSEDDIQIVLNEETSTYTGEKPADGDEDERSEDEDEEDLVIVTGGHDAPLIEEQEWEEQPAPLDSLAGASGATLALGLERAAGGEDKGQGMKAGGGQGSSSGVPRIGYSGQGYHSHHMQYKVRCRS